MDENVADSDTGRFKECLQQNCESIRSEQQTSRGDNPDGCRPTHLDLFSGIGGFALAAKWAGFRTIAFCEIDKYCQKILAQNFGAVVRGRDCEWCGKSEHRRIVQIGEQLVCGYCASVAYTGDSLKLREGSTQLEVEPHALHRRKRSKAADGFRANRPKVFGNIFDFDGTTYRGCALLTGGFPCQPFSVAGKRRGAADDRAIWPEMFRVIREARPAWVLGENVPGIIPMELDNVLSDLESIGYACRPFVIPACAVDARHRRDRLWIIGRRNVAHSYSPPSTRDRNCSIRSETQRAVNSEHCRWDPEPSICRVVNGLPNRSHRLKGLGNAIVPQVAYEILREIRKLI